MRNALISLALGAGSLLMVPSAASANIVGTKTLTDCGSGGSGCPGATYSFNIGATSATLSILINGAPTAGVNDVISGVNLGFTPSANVSNLLLSANPGGGWATVSTGSLSNSGCGGNGGAFICASGTGVSIQQNHTYTWTWTYNLGDANMVSGVADVHIGANYDPHNGLIVSETGASAGTVPEPAVWSLLILGFSWLGFAFRRTQKFAA